MTRSWITVVARSAVLLAVCAVPAAASACSPPSKETKGARPPARVQTLEYRYRSPDEGVPNSWPEWLAPPSRWGLPLEKPAPPVWFDPQIRPFKSRRLA